VAEPEELYQLTGPQKEALFRYFTRQPWIEANDYIVMLTELPPVERNEVPEQLQLESDNHKEAEHEDSRA
jgi:hypothetical protein